MKEIRTFGGRSLVFNVLLITINLFSLVFFLVLCLPSREATNMPFALISALVFFLSIFGIIVFRGKLLFSFVARILTGTVFIVSGLVKANDPVGFTYKLEEYLQDGALAYRIKTLFNSPGFSFESLIPYAFWISVCICTLEILIGVFLLIGGKIKLMACLSLFIMLFFTFLTWHSSSCDPKAWYLDQNIYQKESYVTKLKIREEPENELIEIVSNTPEAVVINEKKHPVCVSDCGCFGDAFGGSLGRSLTPLESFLKDIFLLYLVTWIVLSLRIIVPNKSRQNIIVILSGIALTVIFCILFDWYFPILFFLLMVVSALWMRRIGGGFFSNYWGSILSVILIVLTFITYVNFFDPVKDFRPYAVGKNLREQMNNGRSGIYENTIILRNKLNGRLESYDQKTYAARKVLWNDKKYSFDHMEQKVIANAIPPSITEQFNPFRSVGYIGKNELKLNYVREQLVSPDSNEYISLRDWIVEQRRIFLICAVDLERANWKNIDKINALSAFCRRNKIPAVLITASSETEIKQFMEKQRVEIPIYLNDATELKTISRSNPALLFLENGTVKAKYTNTQTPSVKRFAKEIGL